MSKAKRIDFNVNCDDVDRAEVIMALTRLPNITYVNNGRGMINVSIENASVTEVQVRRVVEEEKQRAREKAEERRVQELTDAKLREKKRVEVAVNEIKNVAEQQTIAINVALQKCTSILDRISLCQTDYRNIKNVSILEQKKIVEKEIERLNSELANISPKKSKLVCELESYKGKIESYSTIAMLNRSISQAPPLHMSATHAEKKTAEILSTIEVNMLHFNILHDFLKCVDDELDTAKNESLVNDINRILGSLLISDIKSVDCCIDAIVAAPKKIAITEEYKKTKGILDKMDAIENSAREAKRKIRKYSQRAIDTIDHKQIYDDFLLKINELSTKISETEKTYLSPIKIGAMQHYKQEIIDIQKQNQYFDVSNIDKLADIKKVFERISFEAEREAKLFTEYKEIEKKYKHLLNLANEHKLPSSMHHYSFNGSDSITVLKGEVAKLDKQISDNNRNTLANLLIFSLHSMDKGYKLFTSEMSDDALKLSFTKKDCFGVVHEYVISRNCDHINRVVQGVRSASDKSLINKDELIAQQKADCADVNELYNIFSRMGFDTPYEEEITPEGAYDESNFKKLTPDLQNIYVEQVFNEEVFFGNEVLSEVEYGKTYADAQQTVKNRIGSKRKTENEFVEKAKKQMTANFYSSTGG